MKILFTISSLNSGGAERVLTTLANELSINHDVIILKSDDDESFYKLNDKVILESVGMNKVNKSIYSKLNHNFDKVKVMRKSIKKYQPDVVISFMDKTNIYTILATRFLNVKVIISERINYEYLRSKIWRVARRLTYPYADGMVVLSKYDYDKYTYVNDKKIIFNPLFIENNEISLEKKEKIILSVGRLVHDKGFDVLLKAISLISKELLQEWKIFIIGDGEKREELKKMSKTLGIDIKVEFLGKRKDIEKYYQKASIFVSTSRAEGFPNALSEALSLGCASIATDCLTGPSELIQNNVNGFLVEVDDSETLKQRLEVLISDKEIRDKFAMKGNEMSKRYCVKSVLDEWENYFEKFNNN